MVSPHFGCFISVDFLSVLALSSRFDGRAKTNSPLVQS